MSDDRITIIVQKDNSKGLRGIQAEAIKNSSKSVSFSRVISESAIEGMKHKNKWTSNLSENSSGGDRITIVMQKEVTKDLKHIQAKAIKEFQKSISFSRVLCEAVREGMKHKNKWFSNLLEKD